MVQRRFDALVQAQHERGSRVWRSVRTLLLTTPFFALNAALPLLPGGAGLTGVAAEVSLAVFGGHYALFVVAALVAARRPVASLAYRVANRLESSAWILGAMALLGLSGSAASIYWAHPAMVVILSYPAILSHRPIRWLLGIGTIVAASLLALDGAAADAAFALMVGGTLVVLQTLTMALAPRAVRAQARAELLAERASSALVELERLRIKRELHDNLGAELTALLWTAQSLDAASEADVATLVQRVREAMGELRTVMREVAPEPMSVDRLVRELERLQRDAVAGGSTLQVVADVDGAAPTTLDAGLCHDVLLVARESVRNAIVHGAAEHVTVCVSLAESLTLRIEDDGRGCVDELSPGEGMLSIEARAAARGGHARWTNRAPRGVRVEATMDVVPGG